MVAQLQIFAGVILGWQRHIITALLESETDTSGKDNQFDLRGCRHDRLFWINLGLIAEQN